MSKLYYLCFYYEPEYKDKIVSFPSVISKIDYVIHAAKEIGFDVNVVSLATSTNGRFKGVSKRIDENETHTYFSSLKTKNPFLNKIIIFSDWIKIIAFLLKNVKKDDKVLVYHSLYNRWWLNVYKKLFKKDFVLQIEDVYTSVHKNISRFKKTEWDMFRLTDKHICVNDILRDRLESEKSVVSYGNYTVPEKFSTKKHDNIRLVYAGVIEQKRNAAFLALSAMDVLPENYELHILGFGDKADIETLEGLIEKSDKKVFYHGSKNGEEYLKFLQNCDIGLSTHTYYEEDMESADHTFPSKVLVYMSNGLRVVAQRLDCLVRSEIGNLIYFYDEPAPQSLAKAIQSIDMSQLYDSRAVINQLDKAFTAELRSLLLLQE